MTIRSEFEYGILRLTIDRPAQRNAFNADMFDQLAGELDAARQNDKVRVVLLKGSTGLFSAGADVRESLNAPETIDAAAGRLFETLRSFPKPIVAEVAGPAVGDAFTILLYCDLVYASDKALFSVPSVALGRTPRFGTAALVFGSAGAARAAEKLLLCEPISADDALAMRLISAVVPEDDLVKVVAAKVARLAVLPPQAVAATKSLLRDARNGWLTAQIENARGGLSPSGGFARSQGSALRLRRRPQAGLRRDGRLIPFGAFRTTSDAPKKGIQPSPLCCVFTTFLHDGLPCRPFSFLARPLLS